MRPSGHGSSRLATFLLLLALLAAAPAPLRSQQEKGERDAAPTAEGFDIPDSLFVVDSVLVTGNEKTRAFVILREMALKPGVPITGSQLEYDQKRIYSIGLFNKVMMRVSPTAPGRANIAIHVVERWYIVPYPILGIREGTWKKAYYGLGLIHTNFRGRNEKLYFSGALGYDPFGSIAYRNPFLDEEGTTFFEGRVSYNKVRNKSRHVLVRPTDVFDEKHFASAITFGKRYGNHHTAWITGEYRIVAVSDYVPAPTISPTGTDRFPTLTVGYAYDSRDLIEYPGSGTYFAMSVTKYGLPGSDLDFARYGIDFRRFIPTGTPWGFSGRVYTNLIAGGTAPSYNHVYIGYQYKVRGHKGEVREGENIFGASAEVHYTVLPPVYFQADFLPSQFGVWKFGVTLAAFGDIGRVWYRGDVLSVSQTLRGYGAGIHFQLPYSIVLRTEYAVNALRRGEFSVDLGAAF